MAALPAHADKKTAAPDKQPHSPAPGTDAPELAPEYAAFTPAAGGPEAATPPAPPGAPPKPGSVLQLQRVAGNRATLQLLSQRKQASATPDAQREVAPVAPPRTRPNPFAIPTPAPAETPETEAHDAEPLSGPVLGAASGASGAPAVQRGLVDDAREALGGLDPTALISQVRSLISGGESDADTEQSSAESEADTMGQQTQTTAEQGEQTVQTTEQETQQEQTQAEQQTTQTESQGQQGETQVGQAGEQGAQEIEAMGQTSQQALSLDTQLGGQGGGAVGDQAAQAAQQAGGGAAAGAAAGAGQAMQAATAGGVRQEAAQGLSCPEADVMSRAAGLGRDALNMFVRGADAMTGGMASRLINLGQRVGQGLGRAARAIGQAVEQIASSVKNRVRQLAQPLINVVNQGMAAAERVYERIRGRVTNAIQGVTTAVRNGVSWLVNQGPAWLRGKISGIQSAIGGAIQRAASLVGGAARRIISSLPGGEAVLSGIDRLRAKITTVVGAIRNKVNTIVERGRAFGERVLTGARNLADRALQTVVQGARNVRDMAGRVVQGIGATATRIYETVVPAPVRRLAGQARDFIGQQVGKVRAAAGEVLKQVEGAVCVPLNEIAEPCINQYLPFNEGQSQQTPNSTTASGGTSSSITLSSSASVTIPLVEFGIPGSAEVGRGASVSISRSGARAYSVAVSGESTVFYKLEEGQAGAASITVDSPTGNVDNDRTDAIWQALSGSGGGANPAAGGGSTGIQTPGDKIGLKAGVKRNLTVNYGFNVANSTCDLASLAGLLATYGLSGAVSAIVPQPFSSIVSAAGSAVAAGGWSSHITGVSLTNTNLAEVSGKVTPGQGQVSGSLGAESSTSVGLQRQDDGSFRPEASFSQALNAQIAGEMNMGGLFNVGGSLGAQGSQSLTLIYDRASGLISPSSMTTSLSATLGIQGFNIQSIPTQFLPSDAAGIVMQNLEAFRRAAVRGNITAQLQLTTANIQALTAHVASYLSTAPIEQVTWEGVMRKVREGMQQLTFDRQLTVTLTEISRAGVSAEGEVNAEGTTIGVAGSVSAERRIVHTLYSSTSRTTTAGPQLNPSTNPTPTPTPTPDQPPVPPNPTPTPTPDHPEPVRPVPDRPTPGPGPNNGGNNRPPPAPTHKNPLDMTADELEADTAGQNELYSMAQETRSRQRGFGNAMIAQARAEGTCVSILKRDDFDAFIAGVLEKVRRKNYPRIGDMPDIVRGRFNLGTMDDVNGVVAAITAQTDYRVIEVVPPRSREGVPMGYPRWHIVVADSNGIIHEWQIGTQAVTDVYETQGINIPPEVGALPEGMHNDLHDIEYDILLNIQKDHPDIAAEVGIPDFRRRVAEVSADAGTQGKNMRDKDARIVALHNECSTILRLLVDRHGPNIIRKYFKHSGSESTENP